MRGNFFSFCLMSFVMLLTGTECRADTVSDILNVWEKPRCYNAEIRYKVWIPQRDEPVEYNIAASQRPPVGDSTLLPADYLIEWEYLSGDTPSRGFSAYTDGHHYRYLGHGRLNEYHLSTDSAAFHATRPSASVQRSAQFASLLPAVATLELRELLADTAWSATLQGNTLTAEMRHGEDIVNRRQYVLGSDCLPVKLTVESNIGAISEQSIEAVYTAVAADCEPLSEQLLIQRHPDIFARHRQSNYSIRNLEGEPLPQMNLPTPTGERYRHNRGDGFRRPTVIALLDAEATLAPQTVTAVRDAVERSPVSADLVLAVCQPNIDAVEQLLGGLQPGEHHLMGARTWALETGAAVLPVILVCNSSGQIAKVITGHNQDLATIVIDSLLKLQ